jgi:hypothetical protein
MPGSDEINRNLENWMSTKLLQMRALGEYYAKKVEAEAKVDAPWTDRTGHARQGLFGEAVMENTELKVRLAHSMDYGMWLEVCNDGKYAILESTIKKNAPQFIKSAKELMQD